ncbi:hypothetical protein PENSUB_238 [Penicillium subrubescens]|uniref:Uncharacterized protein n=1 Tax=Penicillium subrubescens TaxID=1316194 RepID=A0A1Q5UNB9_9EURO|nr:hypothetical protein PENSUB_238 [Penicillium subrubescens]
MEPPSATDHMLPTGASADVFVPRQPVQAALQAQLTLQPAVAAASQSARFVGRCVFLDLGLRENWSLPPPPPPPGVVAEIHNNEPGIRHELNACDILKLHDFRINNIED